MTGETTRLTVRDVIDAGDDSGKSLVYMLQYKHGPSSDVADYWVYYGEQWTDWAAGAFTLKQYAEKKLRWLRGHWWYQRYAWRMIERITQDTVVVEEAEAVRAVVPYRDRQWDVVGWMDAEGYWHFVDREKREDGAQRGCE